MDDNNDCIWAVGLMTGTVLDGNIDVALLKSDGHRIGTFGHYTLAPYKPATVELLRCCVEAAQTWQFDGSEPPVFSEAEKLLTLEQGDAVCQLVERAGLTMGDIGVIGFHGQTVLHRPPATGHDGRIQGKTRQLGDGQLMSRQLGATVVSDFRRADMLSGGQGAPLSAAYHRALLQELPSIGSTAVLNLGGVGNLTWWDGADQLLAFDTGPANAPINDFVQQMGQGDMDRDGRLAAIGMVDEAQLATLLEHPYFTARYPKSLDRFDFSWRMAEGLSAEDGAALLTAFSAAAVGKALDLLPERPQRLIVCGGGRHNPCLMQALEDRTSAVVVPAEDVGWRGDAIEAECFAFLAVRVLKQLPTSFPQTTGASRPVCGGTISRPG
ncbi:MAG: anhydro-N-acetylmuramic acid kinase [Granulosicoccus sp.]